jgi:RNA polymerase sigma-70 factor (ECF subfamily)
MKPPGERDESWFASVYAVHHADVVRYGLRRLADRDASMELAQEVFVVAWRRRAEVPEYSLPWLYGVARNLLANHWRGRRSSPAALPLGEPDALPHPSGGGESDSVPALVDLRAALATLPEVDREILWLIGWEQLTVSEAATVLGCSRTATAVRLHRARKRLAAAMAAAPSPAASSRPAPARF